ncbi:putative cyclase-domain-containing protein [Biscogniauxia mediterranea]|nr:putative cyclase-domain-containing protein [Biscogniauxia mediterranea]
MDASQLPNFDDLPPVPGMPQGCAWGVFDKDGQKDVLGTLNLLTPEVVRAAYAEARDGVSISLNWPLDAMPALVPGRIATTHKQTTLREAGLSSATGWDDELHFNTQSGSQWDSLVHWAHQPTGLFYNGVRAPTRESLLSSSTTTTTSGGGAPTLEHWHARGGLVARGVLVDFAAWAAEEAAEGTTTMISPHPLDGHRITVAQIEAVAARQGVAFRPGDVLVLRTGLTDVMRAPPSPEALARLAAGRVAGMHGCRESARWLWDRHFAAVAGDSWGFEALMPLKEDGSQGGPEDLYLHPWLLAMFGMPIGELWDLSALSAHCKKTGRYSFLLTSAPLNIAGLVGSPPNALALF